MKLEIRPFRIRLDASTICQLRCPVCSNTRGLIGERGFLKLNDFRVLLEKNRYIREVEISNWGEVFLNPELPGIMKCAFDHGVQLYCENSSNLNTVSEEALEGLVKYRFRSLFCSIDGASQNTYSIYRVGGNFESIIRNIERINYYKKRYRSRFPLLTWQFIVFPHNRHEVQRAKAMAARLNMGFYTKIARRPKYISDKERGIVGAGRRIAGLLDESKKRPGRNPTRNRCAQLWLGPQIGPEGEMLGCCGVRGPWGVGNVFSSGFLEVFNGEKMKHARAMVMGFAGEREGIACTKCRTYKMMKKNGRWLSMSELNLLRFGLRARRFFPFGGRYYTEFHHKMMKFMG